MTKIETPVRGQRPKRRAATEEKIVRSVLKLARAKGFNAVTIDAVVADSGVAKTTIYRRYDDRMDMLIDTLRQITLEIPTEYPTDEKGFERYLVNLQDHLENKIGLRLIGSLVSSSDEFIEEWRDRVVAELVDGFARYYRKGIKEGSFSADVNGGAIATMVVGSVLMRAAFDLKGRQSHAKELAAMLWPIVASPESKGALG
ncbi:TetR/AcrR family transcriptional regulator [Corynebacterium qintianiae]|uniref:TetR/AcrR family transcriptional regulator n=1 Tax=Corynebacterium qintianiae TaxID=2709392 RepID=UPI0013E9DDAC|nr:TetR/AcrR family transcriptional regulator [Corynebacterium qintianiae]